MTEQAEATQTNLDRLVQLVDRAAQTIARLQAENIAQRASMAELKAQLQAAQSELEGKAGRIEALEAEVQSFAALKADAEWCRWFRRKYGQSTFYTHIENAYREENLGDSASIIAIPTRVLAV